MANDVIGRAVVTVGAAVAAREFVEAGKQGGDALGKGAGDEARKSLGSRLADGVKAAGRNPVVLAAGAAASAVIAKSLTSGFERLRTIEQAENTLSGLGHSVQDVAKIMANANDAVIGTAFGLGEAARASASAVAAGIAPGEDLTRVLKTVGDVASVTGGSFDEMADIFNQVAANVNGLQGVSIARLRARGVPALEIVAKHLGITAAEAQKMSSAGEISFETFAAAMEEGMGGAALRAGGTFSGALANVENALGRVGAAFLSPIFGEAPNIFAQINISIDKLLPYVEGFADAIGSLAANIPLDILGTFAVALGGVSLAILGIAGAMAVFGVLFSPISLIVLGIAALAAGLYVAWQRSETFRDIVMSVGSYLKDTFTPIFGTIRDAITGQLLPALEGMWDVLQNNVIPAFIAIGEAVLPVIGAIVDAFMNVLPPVIETVIGVFSGLIEMISGFWQIVSSIFTGDWAALWDGVQAVFSGAISALGSLLGGLIRTFVALLGELPGLIGAALSGLWSLLGGLLSSAFSALVSVTVSFFKSLPGLIVSAISGLASAMGKFFTGLFSSVGKIVINGIGTLIGLWLSMPGRILQGLLDLMSFMMNFWLELFVIIGEAIFTGVELAVEFFMALPGRILEALTSLITSIPALLTTIFTALLGAITSGISAAVSLFASLPGRALGAISALPGLLMGVISSMFSSMTGAVSSGIGTVVGYFTELPGRILGVVGAMKTAGGDLIRAVFSGIVSAAGAAGGFVSDLVGKLKTGINNMLKLPLKFKMPRLLGGATLTIIPAFAKGGIAPGGLALVGEEGPELVDLPRGSRVYSNPQSRQMASELSAAEMGGGGVIEINQNFFGPTTGAERMSELDWTLRFGAGDLSSRDRVLA